MFANSLVAEGADIAALTKEQQEAIIVMLEESNLVNANVFSILAPDYYLPLANLAMKKNWQSLWALLDSNGYINRIDRMVQKAERLGLAEVSMDMELSEEE